MKNKEKIVLFNTTKIEPFLTYESLAEKTGLTVSFLKKAKSQYGLPCFKIGSSVRFRLSEVSKWLEDRKVIA